MLGLEDVEMHVLYNEGFAKAKALQTKRDNEAKRVFKAIEDVTGLPMAREEVACYVVSKLLEGIPTLLDPLTLPAEVDQEDALAW